MMCSSCTILYIKPVEEFVFESQMEMPDREEEKRLRRATQARTPAAFTH